MSPSGSAPDANVPPSSAVIVVIPANAVLTDMPAPRSPAIQTFAGNRSPAVAAIGIVATLSTVTVAVDVPGKSGSIVTWTPSRYSTVIVAVSTDSSST